MFTTYEEAIDWIHSRLRLGVKPGLTRMEWMMERLNHPERKIKTIHIGGTNGKGSTLTYIRSILETEGIEVGTFTSPYIEQFNERISINGVPIKDEEIVQLLNDIYPLAIELEGTEIGEPTEFEIITAMAFHYFAHIHPVDIALFEVGLGGRWDSTNVLHPLLSIITSIGLDHTKILGDTYADIAGEKAGIIKSGTPVISGVKQPEALQVINRTAKEKRSTVYQLGKQFSTFGHTSTGCGESFGLENIFHKREGLEISMAGTHQIENASLAVMAAEFLNQYFSFDISEESMKAGLKKAYWPGRFERVSNDPLIILDGAHNQEGIEALCHELEKRYPEKKKQVVFAALADKKLDQMIGMLDQTANKMIFVDFDFPRAAAAKDLYSLSSSTNKIADSDWKAVIQSERDSLSDEVMLVITGSLYFISEIKQWLKDN
ncbi:dihydrofolate synthase/folylpolyglutamate synthase [Cytobacillus purgationiresistens]|uniref:tetrahydrofolate synthase n=2 Tax=Cytobacillus purgationiresistens TaxID=863449 RepID=A0ABU0AFF9_9BACI|nr:folylpolyglutamate synthase/dihydrofolate synthase family protein [Cytobacillus purgationiresistens]MDQ0269997.1 dihydrofolate synthase/folylpolyglutamate synthase [Cytobacillus purgationiresistens]